MSKPITISITPNGSEYDVEITGSNGRKDSYKSLDGIAGVKGRVTAYVENIHLYVEPEEPAPLEGASKEKLQQQENDDKDKDKKPS